MKLQAKACNFIKKETLAQVFLVNFAKFLSTTPLNDCFCNFGKLEAVWLLSLSIQLKNNTNTFMPILMLKKKVEHTLRPSGAHTAQ